LFIISLGAGEWQLTEFLLFACMRVRTFKHKLVSARVYVCALLLCMQVDGWMGSSVYLCDDLFTESQW